MAGRRCEASQVPLTSFYLLSNSQSLATDRFAVPIAVNHFKPEALADLTVLVATLAPLPLGSVQLPESRQSPSQDGLQGPAPVAESGQMGMKVCCSGTGYDAG
jgi:hypothetical protein